MQLTQYGMLGFPNRGGYFVADDGTGDGLSQANPMSTADFITLSASLAVGDVVHFKRGDTFELGELTLNAANLTLSAYGTGDDPVITGSTSIAGLSWSNVGNVWSAAIGSVPKWIFKDGVASKWAQTDWFLVSSKPAADTIRVSAGTRTIINAMSSIVGAKLRVIEDVWIMSYEYEVIAYNSTNGDIQVDRALTGTVASNAPFALFDQQQFLTEANEWWYDSVGGNIYYYSTVNPNTLNIRASIYDEAFNLTADNITIDKLKITNYYFAGINGGTTASNNARIQFCQIVHNKYYAVYAVDCNGYKILSNTIQFGTNGIARTGDNWLISHNTINSFGQDANYPLPIGSYQSTGNGILLWGDNNIIRSNDMTNFSYCGILMTGFDCIVERNQISDFCKLFTDGGGVYTAGVGEVSTTNSGGYIYKNHIFGGAAGTVSMGVYIDNHTTGYTIEENVIYDIPYFGVLCNWDTEETTVINNVFRNCLVSTKFRNDTTRSPLYANNVRNIVTGNVFAAGQDSQRGVEIESYNNDANFDPFSGTGGTIDNNHYLFPYNTNSNIAQARATANGTPTAYTLATWRTKTGDEANSNAIVNLYPYTTEANADDEVLLSINTTESTIVVGIGANYTDEEGTVTTSRTIPDFFAAVSVSQVDRSELVFQDTFTGGAGNITGHTPELGSAWTVEFGTISLDGAGRVGASVTGEMYQTLASSDVIIDATGRVTSTPFTLTILLRYTNINNWIGAQLFITTVAEDSRVILTNRVSGTSTSILQVDPGAPVANTDYKVTAILVGNNIRIYVDDVLWLNYTDTLNANIGANNPTGLKHGLRVPTGVNYTLCEMYEL